MYAITYWSYHPVCRNHTIFPLKHPLKDQINNIPYSRCYIYYIANLIIHVDYISDTCMSHVIRFTDNLYTDVCCFCHYMQVIPTHLLWAEPIQTAFFAMTHCNSKIDGRWKRAFQNLLDNGKIIHGAIF